MSGHASEQPKGAGDSRPDRNRRFLRYAGLTPRSLGLNPRRLVSLGIPPGDPRLSPSALGLTPSALAKAGIRSPEQVTPEMRNRIRAAVDAKVREVFEELQQRRKASLDRRSESKGEVA